MTQNQLKTKQRTPRFRRVSDVSFSLQERDIEIIKQVHKHRFLTSEHIRELTEGSNQGILRRLRGLYHSHYLDRPREQIERYQRGSKPMVYALGNKGADLLKNGFNMPRAKVDWTTKNREVKKFFLEHTLAVADFMVCLELACRQNGDVRIIEPEEILARAPEETRKRRNPYRIKIDTTTDLLGDPKRIKIGVVPDKVFGFYFKDQTKPGYFFLEADLSNEPIIRKDLYRSSFLKKLVGYYLASHMYPEIDNLFLKTFGFKFPRILTITKSDQRIQNMIEANKTVDRKGKGLGMFLFTRIDNFDLKRPERILERIWINGRGEPVSLLD